MKIFISYAREQRALADSLSVRLHQEGHNTFLDITNLPPGEGYDASIRASIESADLFIFLISPSSVRPGAYALTELDIVRKRWPNPSGRVLPVMIEPTPMKTVPPYLTTVTVLQPPGNVEADVLSHVQRIARQHRAKRLWLSGGLAAAAVAGIAATLLALAPAQSAEPCHLKAHLTLNTGSNMPDGLYFTVTYAGKSGDFFVLDDRSAAIDVGPFKGGDHRWKVQLHNPDGSVAGETAFDGCIASPRQTSIAAGYDLVVTPRS
jgi:hypothetical protein